MGPGWGGVVIRVGWEGRIVPGSSLAKEAGRIVFCAWWTKTARAVRFIWPGRREVFRWIVHFPHLLAVLGPRGDEKRPDCGHAIPGSV